VETCGPSQAPRHSTYLRLVHVPRHFYSIQRLKRSDSCNLQPRGAAGEQDPRPPSPCAAAVQGRAVSGASETCTTVPDISPMLRANSRAFVREAWIARDLKESWTVCVRVTAA
jgi:hypothetical protein